MSSPSSPGRGGSPSDEPAESATELHHLSAGQPPIADRVQFDNDKRAVYEHPLFPLLALLLEKCEVAMRSADGGVSDSVAADVRAFVRHQHGDHKLLAAARPEVNQLMVKAIQVLRVHLLELEKVQDLCRDFCSRYITCLKGKLHSENLLRPDYDESPASSPGSATHHSISGAVQQMVHQHQCELGERF
ncbi:homeobox protein PKNOX2-like [Amphibalanus amphitrite]|uniref:homeobox protein PKNOX2-like n=1 Tax=Amphibalanus amphitrite TaxID=1232801 RepID=UPI001C90B00B|nr:homeobox protein PKNOX2-like [Amphibalanus amphitrite]